MGRYGFVQPEVTRLQLTDVHVRALEALRDPAKGVALQGGGYRKPTDEEIAAREVARDEAAEAGAWIDVKRELTAGEARDAQAELYDELHFGERARVNIKQLDFAKCAAYVVGWWLRDPEGKLLPFSAAALKNVNQATFADISAAVDWHEEQSIAAQVARKNETAGTTKS